MERSITSRIKNRFSLLPRRHLIVAGSIAAVLAAAGWLYAPFAPQRYGASAVYSYDRSVISALEAQGHELSAAQLAESVVAEKMKSWQPPEGTTRESAFDPANSRLKATPLEGATLRLDWTGDDPSETTAAAAQFAGALATWTPRDSGYLPVKAPVAAPAPRRVRRAQGVAPLQGTYSGVSRPPVQPNQIPSGNLSDQEKLNATVAGLDARVYQLNVHLVQMRKEGSAAAAAPSASSDASQEVAAPVTPEAGAEALRQRNEVEEQIGDLRKQRYFLLQKAEAAGLDVAALQLPTHRPVAALAAQVKSAPATQAPAAAAPAPQAVLAGLSVAQSIEKVFTLERSPSVSRPVATFGTLAGWLGLAAGLLVAAVYLGVLLWRFRPVHNETMLRALLPQDVLFLGGLEQRT